VNSTIAYLPGRDGAKMKKNIIDLHRYRQAKADYQKLLERNPYTCLRFEDYFKVREFLEKVHRAKLKKKREKEL
jgi:hypothetical protein